MRFVDISKVAKFLASAWQGAIYSAVFVTGCLVAGQVNYSLGLGALGAGILILPVFLAQMLLFIIVHEFGHAGAAWLVGWRVQVITIWGLSYFPAEKRFERSRKPRRRWGGSIFAIPQLTNTAERGRIVLTLGGPFANLVLGAGGLFLALPLSYSQAEPNTWALAAADLSISSVMFGVANLSPWWGKTTRSDGAALLEFIFEKLKSSGERNWVWVYSQAFYGVSPAYWDAQRIRLLRDYEGTEAENNQRDMLLLSYYLSLGDAESARVVTERQMRTAKSNSTHVALQHAFLVAFVDNQTEEARKILDEIPIEARDSFLYWRAIATVKSRLGEISDAREAVKNARSFATRDMSSPDQDDDALFSAIEKGLPLPILIPRAGAA